MQIVEVVRRSYNERKGTNISRQDLLDPRINVQIAGDLLSRIAHLFDSQHGPRAPNMRQNWNNPEFVRLVVAGWNSGYSERAGVGRVARYLEDRGIPVTHNNVFKYAAQAGATRHLQNETKRRWQRTVVDLYMAQPDRPSPGGFAIKVALVAFTAWGLYKLLK
jgi:hypothetical protein